MALVLFMTTAARADNSWLEVRTDAACPAEHLADQIAERIVGERNAELSVRVDLRREAGATVAALDIVRGSETLGERTLRAPTCEEALAAVAAVVALAVSHPPGLPTRATERAEQSSLPAPAAAVATPLPEGELAPPARPSARSLLAAPPSRKASFERDASARQPELREVRFVGAAGVDVGTLTEPGPVLGVGARAGAGWGELRGVAWYGLPSTREEVSVVTERTRVDFLALSLDYCHGLDKERWLGLCAGLETSLRRTLRREQAGDEPAREEARLEPTCGPLLSAAFAYRSARWVPELDVSMRLPLLEATGSARFGFRAAIGVALPF